MTAIAGSLGIASMLRVAAALVFVVIVAITVSSNRARAQQSPPVEDDTARSLVLALQDAEEQFFAQHKRYGEISEMLGVPAYALPVDEAEVGNYNLHIVITTDGKHCFIAADGSSMRYSSNAEGGIDATDFSTLNAKARDTLRTIVATQASYYAAHGRYGQLTELAAGGFIEERYATVPAHAGLGVFVKHSLGTDGQSYTAMSVGHEMHYAADESGEVRAVLAVSAAEGEADTGR